MKGPKKEEDFWPFGPTAEPVKKIGDVTGEETCGLAFTVEEGLVGILELWRRTLGSLVTLIRSLEVVATINHLWLVFTSLGFVAVAPLNTGGQFVFLGTL